MKTILKKDRKVEVNTKTGASYSYKFTTLAKIHEYLEENNFRYYAFVKRVEGDDYCFIQKMMEEIKADGSSSFREVGDPIQGAKILPSQNVQEYGGNLTAARRYSLLMAYGLACEDDENDSKSPAINSEIRPVVSANKPASQKQIDAIRRLLIQNGFDDGRINEILSAIKNSANASAAIKYYGEMRDRYQAGRAEAAGHEQ